MVEKYKYKNFTDDELYILKRQTIESSFEIETSGRYDEDEIKTHTKLMNEIIDEIKIRDK